MSAVPSIILQLTSYGITQALKLRQESMEKCCYNGLQVLIIGKLILNTMWLHIIAPLLLHTLSLHKTINQ